MEKGNQRLINVGIFVRPGPSGLSRLNGIFHKNNLSHTLPGNGSRHANMHGIIFGARRPQVFPTHCECHIHNVTKRVQCVSAHAAQHGNRGTLVDRGVN